MPGVRLSDLCFRRHAVLVAAGARNSQSQNNHARQKIDATPATARAPRFGLVQLGGRRHARLEFHAVAKRSVKRIQPFCAYGVQLASKKERIRCRAAERGEDKAAATESTQAALPTSLYSCALEALHSKISSILRFICTTRVTNGEDG